MTRELIAVIAAAALAVLIVVLDVNVNRRRRLDVLSHAKYGIKR